MHTSCRCRRRRRRRFPLPLRPTDSAGLGASERARKKNNNSSIYIYIYCERKIYVRRACIHRYVLYIYIYACTNSYYTGWFTEHEHASIISYSRFIQKSILEFRSTYIILYRYSKTIIIFSENKIIHIL